MWNQRFWILGPALIPGRAPWTDNLEGMLLSRAALPAAVLTLAAGLTACTPIADVEPAPDAANPDCATVMVSLPSELAGEQQRETDSQSSSAWGDPSKIILRCGVPVPGPTTEQCATVNGIDWILQEDETAWKIGRAHV